MHASKHTLQYIYACIVQILHPPTQLHQISHDVSQWCYVGPYVPATITILFQCQKSRSFVRISTKTTDGGRCEGVPCACGWATAQVISPNDSPTNPLRNPLGNPLRNPQKPTNLATNPLSCAYPTSSVFHLSCNAAATDARTMFSFSSTWRCSTPSLRSRRKPWLGGSAGAGAPLHKLWVKWLRNWRNQWLRDQGQMVK